MKNNTAKITPFPTASSKKKNNSQKLIMAEMSLCMIALVSLIGISELFVVGSYSISKSHVDVLHTLPIMY